MPFTSESQRRYLWSQHPSIAAKWAKEYPASNKNLPKHKRKKSRTKNSSAFGLFETALENLTLGDSAQIGMTASAKTVHAGTPLTMLATMESIKQAGNTPSPSVLEDLLDDQDCRIDSILERMTQMHARPATSKLAAVLSPEIAHQLGVPRVTGLSDHFDQKVQDAVVGPNDNAAQPPPADPVAPPGQDPSAGGQDPSQGGPDPNAQAAQGELNQYLPNQPPTANLADDSSGAADQAGGQPPGVGPGANNPSVSPIQHYGPISASGAVTGNAGLSVPNSSIGPKNAALKVLERATQIQEGRGERDAERDSSTRGERATQGEDGIRGERDAGGMIHAPIYDRFMGQLKHAGADGPVPDLFYETDEQTRARWAHEGADPQFQAQQKADWNAFTNSPSHQKFEAERNRWPVGPNGAPQPIDAVVKQMEEEEKSMPAVIRSVLPSAVLAQKKTERLNELLQANPQVRASITPAQVSGLASPWALSALGTQAGSTTGVQPGSAVSPQPGLAPSGISNVISQAQSRETPSLTPGLMGLAPWAAAGAGIGGLMGAAHGTGTARGVLRGTLSGAGAGTGLQAGNLANSALGVSNPWARLGISAGGALAGGVGGYSLGGALMGEPKTKVAFDTQEHGGLDDSMLTGGEIDAERLIAKKLRVTLPKWLETG